MCTVVALADSGQLTLEADTPQEVVLETPGGLTTLHVTGRDQHVASVTYDALPGFVLPTECSADVNGWGTVRYNLVYGGASYAVLSGPDIALDPAHTPTDELAAFLGAFFAEVAGGVELTHPEHGRMPPLTLGLMAGTLRADATHDQVIDVAAYMHPGVICQGPTGTGTTALLAWLQQQGRIGPGTTLRTASPYGHAFVGTLTDNTRVGEHLGVRTTITGHPQVVQRGQILLQVDDTVIDRSILGPRHSPDVRPG